MRARLPVSTKTLTPAQAGRREISVQSDRDSFTRRHFLQWTSAGLAASSAQSLLPAAFGEQESAAPGERVAPSQPIVLKSAQLEVTLDGTSGLPYGYRLLRNDAQLRGEDFGEPMRVTLCRREPWSFQTAPIEPERHHATKTSAAFEFAAKFGGTPAVRFTLHYVLTGSTLRVETSGIEEAEPFQLIEVALPRLVTVRESDSGAWLAHGDEGGSHVTLTEAQAGSLPANRFWGKVLGTLPVVMVGTAQAMCIQETTAFMDGTTLVVAGGAGSRRASLGTIQVHRVNGSDCYDLNLEKGAPRNCGNQNTPNLLVEQPSSCRLDFLEVSGDADKAWIAAGRFVRERMPAIPTHFYDDQYVYGIHCDEPLLPAPSATFEQCHDIVARVAALTDHAPQVVHLWGWQFRGKDTGYPAVDVVDARIGGYAGMMRLMEQGPSLNAHITLADNYDDAYRSSPAWNEAVIARRPDGQLWQSRSWTGEKSYILGLAKYMEGPGTERVRYTCERYQLRQTTHVDVLSYYSIRNDWDAEHPASGIRNLRDGRYKVLEGFAAHGVDVSSEALRYPMIGHISCYWYLTGPARCPFGGKPIPLVPLIYGKSAVWGLSGPEARGDDAKVRILQRFYGACPHGTVRADTADSVFLDAFYLGMVPFFALRGRNLEDFEREGDETRIHLEGGAVIESNLEEKTLRIALHGADVLQDDAVFCPLGEEKIACYSIAARTVTATLPESWNPGDVAGVALSADGREEVKIAAEGRSVQVELEGRRPVMLYRSRAAARLS
jgi:hypothetical protein